MHSSTSSERSSSLFPSAIGFGIISFYILFTLLPNSNSLMVKWPWVFLWQFGLMLGPILLISQLWRQSFRPLGNRLDWLAISWSLVLILSAAFAQFTHQSIWYSWAALCAVAFLYVIHSWLTSTALDTTKRIQRLLIFQGLLSIVFSSYSLVAWLLQTVKPYLQTLEQLKGYGIERNFDLQVLILRNWHPLGHQNYVAGYLVLAIPLLLGLALSSAGPRCFGWLAGCAVSLATLYSTASRGSWFGLLSSIIVFILLTAWYYPKLRKSLLGVATVSFSGFFLWGASSPRIRGLFSSLLSQGGDGELSYRAVTNATGWFMGLAHPLFGVGLGGVPLLYQKYRPTWAGQEAELTYQLHSTPAQLWAELGLCGIVLSLLSLWGILHLTIRWCRFGISLPIKSRASDPFQFSVIGIISGLLGYGVYAITDYQLDNVCISGTLLIYIAVLVVESNRTAQLSNVSADVTLSKLSNPTVYKKAALAGTSFLLAISIWLYPVHRAWMFSSQGFLALQQDDFASFVVRLEQAHKLAPWEPYYPYQLAWNLGELAFQRTDAVQQEALRQESVKSFEQAIALSPHREFGYSNLGWLQVNAAPEKATAAFFQSIKLAPEKRGAYFALGYSLLKEGKTDLATQAMVIELMRQPVLLTSSIWQSADLAALYPKVVTALESAVLSNTSVAGTSLSDSRNQQMLGMLYWWQGDYVRANEVFTQVPNALNKAFMALTNLPLHELSEQPFRGDIADANVAIAAWINAPNSDAALLKAALSKDPNITYIEEAYYTALLSDIKASIAESTDFYQWLTQSPSRPRRNQRLGFGTISRHIDGSLPKDFAISSENILMTKFLSAAFPATMPHRDVEILVKALTDAVLAGS